MNAALNQAADYVAAKLAEHGDTDLLATFNEARAAGRVRLTDTQRQLAADGDLGSIIERVVAPKVNERWSDMDSFLAAKAYACVEVTREIAREMIF